jgi:hypothetical protein
MAVLPISQIFSVGIGTLDCPVMGFPGCRGFIGPVPPPLWIVCLGAIKLILLSYHRIIRPSNCQMSGEGRRKKADLKGLQESLGSVLIRSR